MISVTAPGAAPVGLEATGKPIFRRARLHAGAPGVSTCQCWNDGALPLGLQVLCFPQGDASAFAVAGWIEDALRR